MLVAPEDCPLPYFDTTHLHVEAALAMALSP
jgi:aspartate/glutamate racemase